MTASKMSIVLLAAVAAALAAMPGEASASNTAPGESVVVTPSGGRILLSYAGNAPQSKEAPPGRDVTAESTLANHDGTPLWNIRAVNFRFATRLTMPNRATSRCTLRALRFDMYREATGNRQCNVYVWDDVVVGDEHRPGTLVYSSAFTSPSWPSGTWYWCNFNMPTGGSAVTFDTSANFWVGISRPTSGDPYPGDDGSFAGEYDRNAYWDPSNPTVWEYWGADFMNEAVVRYGRIDYDVAVTSIITPTGIIDSTANIAPSVQVTNLGFSTAAYNVRMRIGGFYDETVNVPSHPQQSPLTVNFPAWNQWPRGSWTVNCSTSYGADQYPWNDRRLGVVTSRVIDARCSQINAPPDSVNIGDWATPQAVALNNGTEDAVVQAKMRIGTGYVQYATTSLLLPGTQEVLDFVPWQATAAGEFAVGCSTSLAGDMNPGNNLLERTVFVRYADAQCLSILDPTGMVDYGASVVPRAEIANNSNYPREIPVRMRIGDYDEFGSTGLLPPGGSVVLSFPAWTATVGGANVVSCSTRLIGDAVPANDSALGEVFVRLQDVAAVSIDLPGPNVDSGPPAAPLVTVRNAGTSAASFPVQLTIGPYLGTATVTDLDPGASLQVALTPDWEPQRGTHNMRLITQYEDDFIRSNDTVEGGVYVAVHDIGVSTVVSPAGVIATGTEMTPIVNIANYGNEAAVCLLRFIIRDELSTVVYDRTEAAVNVPLGGLMGYPMGLNWTAEPSGSYTSEAYTIWGPDVHDENDTAHNAFIVTPGGGLLDVGVTSIISPARTIDTGTVVFPRARVTNLGSYTASFDVAFHITFEGAEVYYDVRPVVALAPQTSTTVIFDEWPTPHPLGDHVARCSTMLAADGNQANDRLITQFSVIIRPDWPEGWHEVEPMPLELSNKSAKDGAWLAYDNMTGLVFAAKGNKTFDFYTYDPIGLVWTRKDPIPNGAGKGVSKGGHGCTDGSGTVFATKGNNTLEFYRYAAGPDSGWVTAEAVPLGEGKKVKGGTDMVHVPGSPDFLYLLKGYGNEFYRYDVTNDSWQRLANAPATASAKYDKGSFMVYDGGGNIYVHQAKYHKLYAYDIGTQTWLTTDLPGMPFTNRITGQSKKSKDGAAGTWSGNGIYAFKGGNTQEFWYYQPGLDSGWVERDTIPAWGSTARKKKVKAGGDLTSFEAGIVFALKGNKTRECWRYVEPLGADGRDGVMAGQPTVAPCRLTIAPNPLASGFATIRLSGPVSQWPSGLVRVFDATGRCVLTRPLEPSNPGTFSLDLRTLANGVYLARVTSTSQTVACKLVVER